MDTVLISTSKLNQLANTIHNKLGTKESLTLDEMEQSIESVTKSDLPVTFGTSLTSIKDNMFSNTGLQSIVIPSSVTSIGKNSFSNCSYLKEIDLNNITIFGNGTAWNPEYGCFYNSSNLENVKYSKDLTYIMQGCFKNCSSLKTFSYKENEDEGVVRIADIVTTIGDDAFRFTNIENLYLPNTTMSYLGGYCFANNTNLKSVNIPTNIVETLPNNLFEKCTSLESINIPEGIITLNNAVFSGCTSLKESTGGKSITYFGDNIYYGCVKLTTANCNKDLTYLGAGVFNGCSNLTNFSYLDEEEQGICRLPNTVKIIGNDCFREAKFTKLYLPETSLDYFGSYSFYHNTELKDISIPNFITSLPVCCFHKCTSIEEIYIPDSVTLLNNAVFSGCTSLKEVHLGSGITTINENVFNECPISDVYYNGTESDWAKITISTTGNSSLINAPNFHWAST